MTENLPGRLPVPEEAAEAAREARYGEPVDTYTWDRVAAAVLAAAAPVIASAERERIARLAEEHGAVYSRLCSREPHPGSTPFADLIREETRNG